MWLMAAVALAASAAPSGGFVVVSVELELEGSQKRSAPEPTHLPSVEGSQQRSAPDPDHSPLVVHTFLSWCVVVVVRVLARVAVVVRDLCDGGIELS